MTGTLRPGDQRREINALRAVAKAAKRLRDAEIAADSAFNSCHDKQFITLDHRRARAALALDTALAKLRPGWAGRKAVK